MKSLFSPIKKFKFSSYYVITGRHIGFYKRFFVQGLASTILKILFLKLVEIKITITSVI